MLRHIEWIGDAARIAPSRDNLQPWRLAVDGETISFHADAERDRSPANIGGRMARIAVGAALECALLRAGRMGATVRFQPPRPGALATVTFTGPKREPEPDKALVRRATNRRIYDGRPVDDETVAWLREATPPADPVRTLWFGRERVRLLGPLVEEAEALFYGDPALRDASMRAVRFDVRDREEVPYGISIGSLELSGPERVTLDALRKTPQDRLAAMGVFKKVGAQARRLMESASGVCVIVARGAEPATDVTVGRCMQRAWLSLTRRGLVAQPMAAMMGLEAVVDDGPAAGVTLAEGDRATALLAALRAAFPNVDPGSRIAMILRFGRADAPTARAGRRPLAESLAASTENADVDLDPPAGVARATGDTMPD